MERRNEVAGIFLGVFLVFGLNIAVVVILGIVGFIVVSISNSTSGSIVSGLWFSLLFIGISQLIYVIPTIILLTRRRRWGLMKGVIIGAVITALLNGGCWLLFTGGIR